MKGKKIQKCLAAILAVSVGVTSVPWPDSRVYAAEELTSENESDSMLEQEGTSETEEGEYAVSSEIMEERTERKTVFDLGDGRKKEVLYLEPVRFENEEGQLMDYDASLVSVSDEISMNGMPLEDMHLKTEREMQSTIFLKICRRKLRFGWKKEQPVYHSVRCWIRNRRQKAAHGMKRMSKYGLKIWRRRICMAKYPCSR